MKAKVKTKKAAKITKAQLQYLESNFDKETEKELCVNTGLGVRVVRNHLKGLQSKEAVQSQKEDKSVEKEQTPEEFLKQELEKEQTKENERIGLYHIKDGSIVMTPGQSRLDDIIREQTVTQQPRYHKNIHYIGKRDG